MKQILFLAVAGALGTLSRYGLGGLAQKISVNFPYGTLIINLLGCLIIGFIMQVALNTDLIPSNLRVVITIGFLGAFTTFSTFSYETIKFMEDGAFVAAILNITSNVGLGLLATFFGILLGRITLGGI
ncbi:MAG TPA: fluoride efflux transporter CrcB [Dehalococcoidales bacterium]|nr:fluoride efflux transporter CrcB [Dehalococcoidales bacterium]